MEQGYRFNRGRMVMDGKDVSIFQLSKSEVVNLNFDRLLKEIQSVDHGPTKGFSSIALTIDGYNDVTDELYEIDKVRRFFSRLVKKIPHLLYYMHPYTRMPIQIIGSLSDYAKVAHGEVLPPSVVLKRDGHLDNVGEHTAEFHLPADIGYTMIDAIRNHAEKVGFEDKDKELPVVLKFIEMNILKEHRREQEI